MPNIVATRWPDHWYFDQDHVQCIVLNCGFVAPSKFVGAQWDQLRDHCKDTPSTDHAILGEILLQTTCRIGNCDLSVTQYPQHGVLRRLLAHEKDAHHSAKMSNICSFVTLAREGRIVGRQGINTTESKRVTFDRMMQRVLAMPDATKNLLFQRAGFHNPDERTPKNLARILTADNLAQLGENPPYWWPIRAEHFLWLIRPNPNDPADHHWRIVWTGLREQYAEGIIRWDKCSQR